MPRQAKELTALAVSRLTKPGRHAVGGVDGLALVISDTGQRSWSLRLMVGGKRREMGLGSERDVKLAQAREVAREQRRMLKLDGVDPIAARKEREQVLAAARAREVQTLEAAARDYHARVIEPTRTEKHGAQWLASLENHVPASLWHRPIDEITAPDLLAALNAIKPHEDARNLPKGHRIAETISRVRQRLDAIFEDAMFNSRATSNPAAAVRRKLREMWPSGKKPAGKFAALPYPEAPKLLASLRAMAGTGARCLEFAVLTAARTSEALMAEWSEFDLKARVWTVPGDRMKAGESHTVYLSDAAMAVLAGQKGRHERWVFPSDMPGYSDSTMSNMTMLNALDRLGVRDKTTVHGLCRATFSTWANETGAARPDVIEACLAHNEQNRVRAAYNRAEFAAERRALLAAWAEYLSAPSGARVAPKRRTAPKLVAVA